MAHTLLAVRLARVHRGLPPLDKHATNHPAHASHLVPGRLAIVHLLQCMHCAGANIFSSCPSPSLGARQAGDGQSNGGRAGAALLLGTANLEGHTLHLRKSCSTTISSMLCSVRCQRRTNSGTRQPSDQRHSQTRACQLQTRNRSSWRQTTGKQGRSCSPPQATTYKLCW